jgi:hypothetical protein
MERTMRRIHPIVLGGSLVAVLDIAAALALNGSFGTPPIRVLQAIASGVLGAAAFRGGLSTAALGMSLHVLIAFTVAAAYYAVSQWWPLLTRRPVACGLTYGVLVYGVMNQVVLPLSRVNFRPPRWQNVAAMVAIHMVCVGLPAALSVARGGVRRSKTGIAPGAGVVAR